MSNKRLLTATIDGNTYELGEQYVLGKATASSLGGIKVGSSTSSSVSCTTPTGEVKNYAVNIDSNGKAYVAVPSTTNTNTNIATTTNSGIVRIPTNSGLTVDSNGSLKVCLKAGNGIGTSVYDSNNPSYLMLEKATDNSLGGIKTGYIADGAPNTYGVELNSAGKAFVHVPSGKEIQLTSESRITLAKDTIIVNMHSPKSSILITHSYLDAGDECELILGSISELAISTSATDGFYMDNINTLISNNLYWENGGKPEFDKTKIYRIKFTKIETSTISNQFGKYLVSYTSNYVNKQNNAYSGD